jgi:hypothetical protein
MFGMSTFPRWMTAVRRLLVTGWAGLELTEQASTFLSPVSRCELTPARTVKCILAAREDHAAALFANWRGMVRSGRWKYAHRSAPMTDR